MSEEKRIHLFYLRYYQWISIGLGFESIISNAGEAFYFVCNTKTRRVLLDGLGYPNRKIILGRDVSKFLEEQPSGEVQVYVQASQLALEEELPLLAPELDGKTYSVNVYPDGYTNKFYMAEEFSEKISTTDSFGFGKTYSFDIDALENRRGFGKFQHAVMSSAALRHFTQTPVAQNVANEAFDEIEPFLSKNLLVVMLRPWGSPKFLGGKFKVEDPVYEISRILTEFIREVANELSPDVTVALRADHRDPNLSRALIERVMKEGGHRIISVAENWPTWMTFEPFLDLFANRFPDCRLHTISLDSSGSLPFLALGVGETHYVGFPFDLLPPHLADSDVFRVVKAKVGAMESHINELPSDKIKSLRIRDHLLKASVSD